MLGPLLGLVGLLGVVVLLPLELGDGVALDPMPLELGELELLLPLVDPPVLPLELDLLKYASHSEREICPSWFVSTAWKLGAVLLEELPPLDALLPLDMPDEELGEVPEPDDDPAAMATPAIAKSAAAVAVPTVLSIGVPPSQGLRVETAPREVQGACRARQFPELKRPR